MRQWNILNNTMQKLKVLTALIEKEDKRGAISLLKDIHRENACSGYAFALEKILLIETAKELNDRVSGFYIDAEKLKTDLFSENPPAAEDVVKKLCIAMKRQASTQRVNAYKKAQEYINRHLTDNQLTTLGAAEYAGVTQSTLAKLFSRNAGVTPGYYLNRLRVEKSMEYLKEGLSVEKTSLKVGFSSCETYIRVFKKLIGKTPGEWKRNNVKGG